MFNVCVIGAGQIGSRHLQALKKVKIPLQIVVIDPSTKSLAVAQKRYNETVPGKTEHSLSYSTEIPIKQSFDLAIIATTSDVRAGVIKNLLRKNKVRYFILEKLLFDKKKDYFEIEKLFSKLKIKAWVNCPLRLRPVYQKIKSEIAAKNLSFRITGSRLGLTTNAIHYLDVIAFLTGDNNFKVNTEFLNTELEPSKRKGFLEINGALFARFKNGASCEITSYPSGDAPRFIEIFSQKARFLFSDQELDGEARFNTAKQYWQWGKFKFHTPLVSETTTRIAENILKNGRCNLTPFNESVKMHLNLLEQLKKFLNKKQNKNYDHYPFT